MNIRIHGFYLFLLLAVVSFIPLSFAQTYPITKPKVLLFPPIDVRHLAQTTDYWGNDVGINGFMLAYVAQWWSTKSEIFDNLEILKKINTQGRKHVAAWFHINKEDAEKYVKDGKWKWDVRYQMLPTDPNINEYIAVLKKFKKIH